MVVVALAAAHNSTPWAQTAFLQMVSAVVAAAVVLADAAVNKATLAQVVARQLRS